MTDDVARTSQLSIILPSPTHDLIVLLQRAVVNRETALQNA